MLEERYHVFLFYSHLALYFTKLLCINYVFKANDFNKYLLMDFLSLEVSMSLV